MRIPAVEPTFSPFRPAQPVEALVPDEDPLQNSLTEKLALLLKETQALPQVQALTEAEIAAEIAADRNGQ